MRYIIFSEDLEGDERMFSAPVGKADAQYLLRWIIPNLKPLSDQAYKEGPVAMLATAAKYSYVLYEDDALWCVEWQPGLVVVRLSPSGELSWVALRSPVPDFGGREAQQSDIDAYSEDADNYQYNLVFEAWDAQYDIQSREGGGFELASAAERVKYEVAMAHANALTDQILAQYGDRLDEHCTRCVKNLEVWCGEGLRHT